MLIPLVLLINRFLIQRPNISTESIPDGKLDTVKYLLTGAIVSIA